MSLKSCFCLRVWCVWAACLLVGAPGMMAAEGGTKKLRFSEVAKTAASDTRTYKAAGSPGAEKLHVRNQAILTQDHVQSCEAGVENGQWRLRLKMDKEGAAKFREASKRLKGRQIAIIIEDRLVSAPMLMEEIQDGVLIISGNFTEPEARDLAKGLQKPASAVTAPPST